MNIKPKSNAPAKNKAEKRPPRKISETYLHNAGLYYLERYSTSSNNFRSVMMRKVYKSCHHHTDQDIEACAAMVDALVEKFERTELLNDPVYTRAMVTSLRRQGKSRSVVMNKLKSKGLAPALIADTLAAHDEALQEESGINPELRAALIFARKKKFGPFYQDRLRQVQEIDEHKAQQRVLAAFARNGFSYETSQIILKMPREDADRLL